MPPDTSPHKKGLSGGNRNAVQLSIGWYLTFRMYFEGWGGGYFPAVILEGNTYAANEAGNVNLKGFAPGEEIWYSPSEGCVSKLCRGQHGEAHPLKMPPF